MMLIFASSAIPESGGAFRVSVYSPYIILNKTGIDLQIKAGSVIATSKFQAEDVGDDGMFMQRSYSHGLTDNCMTIDTKKKAIPMMFSYSTLDTRNRALLRVADSLWSTPQSFEAIGGNTDVVVPSSDRVREIHLGIHIAEGQGKVMFAA